jgi:hypothetical protein
MRITTYKYCILNPQSRVLLGMKTAFAMTRQ